MNVSEIKYNTNYLYMRYLFLIGLICTLLFSCNEKTLKSTATTTSKSSTNLHEFALPVVPAFLTDTEGRMSYVIRNYWKNFNFKDTTWLAEP